MRETTICDSTHYANATRKLRVLFLFINHMDKWNTGGSTKSSLERQWRAGLTNLIERDYPALKGVRLGVASTQLDPDRETWPEAKIAMTSFADMMGK